jgi:hypothetical protein
MKRILMLTVLLVAVSASGCRTSRPWTADRAADAVRRFPVCVSVDYVYHVDDRQDIRVTLLED